MEKFSLEQIRNFWTQQALEHGQAPSASWSDQMVIEMEIRAILPWLTDGDRVLDVGCANGYSTLQFASQKQIHIRGLDYIPAMIEHAQAALAATAGRLRGAVEFQCGDIRALREPAEYYDKVIVIRVIINLAEWDSQLQALRECARSLKPGGLLLLSEATLQGWQRLNDFRQEWGLPPIPMPPFNQYLNENDVIEAIAPELELVEAINFASTYYIGTRVIKPLLAQATGADVDIADPNMHWNRWFAQLPAGGDYGTQKLFIFRKR